jgi:hypothetical protein
MKFASTYFDDCPCPDDKQPCEHQILDEYEQLISLIDSFVLEMKRDVRESFLNGKKGWDTLSMGELKELLTINLRQEDWVDAANILAFLWNRGMIK